MKLGDVGHFLSHSSPVAGCEPCARGAPRGRSADKDAVVVASMRSLRDDIAAQALHAIIMSSPPYVDPEAAARLSLKYADAYLAARGAVMAVDEAGGRA